MKNSVQSLTRETRSERRRRVEAGGRINGGGVLKGEEGVGMSE